MSPQATSQLQSAMPCPIPQQEQRHNASCKGRATERWYGAAVQACPASLLRFGPPPSPAACLLPLAPPLAGASQRSLPRRLPFTLALAAAPAAGDGVAPLCLPRVPLQVLLQRHRVVVLLVFGREYQGDLAGRRSRVDGWEEGPGGVGTGRASRCCCCSCCSAAVTREMPAESCKPRAWAGCRERLLPSYSTHRR